jgi:hypothetical protein
MTSKLAHHLISFVRYVHVQTRQDRITQQLTHLQNSFTQRNPALTQHTLASKSSRNLVLFEVNNTAQDISVPLMTSVQSEFHHLRHCCHCQPFVSSYGLIHRTGTSWLQNQVRAQNSVCSVRSVPRRYENKSVQSVSAELNGGLQSYAAVSWL